LKHAPEALVKTPEKHLKILQHLDEILATGI
jgi:hypothetical protein